MAELELQGHRVTLPDDPKILRWFLDEAEIRDTYWRPGPGEVVLDVGCHIGSYTIPALAAGAWVYAVDPSVELAAELVRLVAMNPQIDSTRLTVVTEAMAEKGGYPAEVRDGLAMAPWRDLYPATDAVFSTVDDVIREYFPWLDRLDWVKIDVEGGEASVLRGGLATWRRFHPVMIIEDHTDVYPFVEKMGSARQCLDLLDGLGYRVQSVRYEPTPTKDSSPDRTFWIARHGADHG